MAIATSGLLVARVVIVGIAGFVSGAPGSLKSGALAVGEALVAGGAGVAEHAMLGRFAQRLPRVGAYLSAGLFLGVVLGVYALLLLRTGVLPRSNSAVAWLAWLVAVVVIGGLVLGRRVFAPESAPNSAPIASSDA